MIAGAKGGARVAPLLRAQARVETQRQDIVPISRGHAAVECVSVSSDAAASQWRAESLARPFERSQPRVDDRFAAAAAGPGRRKLLLADHFRFVRLF